MSDLKVVKFDPCGLEDPRLLEWEAIPEDTVTAGTPIQRGHFYFNIGDGMLTAGVWDCTAYESILEPYGVNEFMCLLEGTVSIIDRNGHEEVFNAGECFILPKGFSCIWKQTEYVRKYFMIFDDPSGMLPAHPGALAAIRVDLSLSAPLITQHDESQYIGAPPQMHWLTLYRDVTAQFEAGIWECSPMQRVPTKLVRSELMHIVKGCGTITNADGDVFAFSRGDTFLVPFGMGCQWTNHETVKKIFCSFTPDEEAVR